MSWIELFCLRPEEELLRDNVDQHFAHKRISTLALSVRSLYEGSEVDCEALYDSVYQIYQRVESGRRCSPYDMEMLWLFVNNFQLILLGLIKSVHEAEELMPILELGVQLDDQWLLLEAEDNNVTGDELEQLIWDKSEQEDFFLTIYVDELKDRVRRYSIFAPAPYRPNILGVEYNEDGYPEKLNTTAKSIVEMIRSFEGVHQVAFVGGAIIVVLRKGYDWHKQCIDEKIGATVSEHFGLNCSMHYSESRLMPPDDYEGVS